MLQSLMIGIIGIVGVMILWMLVQNGWRDTFSENIQDDDVLAGRTSCGNCGCSRVCQLDRKPITDH